MNIQFNEIIGGFGLFLFGIKFLGDGLKSIAGDKLGEYIDKYTSRPIMGLLIGIVITVAIQSSSATTAITIGLVRAGLMKLEQAAGIVVGANIGTTITSFLIGLNVEDSALYFVFIGAMLLVFAKKKKLKFLGEIALGFGLLFYGLTIMGDALKVISKLPEFETLAYSMTNNPILGLITGTLMTTLIQSSSAVVGIIQKIYETNIDILPFIGVLPFIFGANIGTTITGILAALGGSVASKRTAAIHTIFNLFGTIIGMLLLIPFASFITNISVHYNINPMMQIAISHIIFNVITTVLFFPLLKFMCKFVKKIIVGSDVEVIDIKIDQLDVNLAYTLPSSALELSKQASYKLSEIVKDLTQQSHKYFNNSKPTVEDKEIAFQTEALINNLDIKLTNYLTTVSKESLTDQDFSNYNLYIDIIKNYERIADLSVNLIEFYEIINEDKIPLSEFAKNDINQMYKFFFDMYEYANIMYRNNSLEYQDILIETEELIDKFELKARDDHFKRIMTGECKSSIAGAVYCDILGVLERMSDHCCNILRAIKRAQHN